MNLFFVKLKRNFIPLLFFVFMLCLIFFSKSNIIALNIWINNVVPSLFPFFIATELLNNTNIPKQIGYLFNKIMRPLFNVPGIGAYALFMGVVSGYPVGAKIVTNFRNNNLCTKEEAERLITFTNNSGRCTPKRFAKSTKNKKMSKNTCIFSKIRLLYISNK